MRNTEIRETPIEENMKTLLPHEFIEQGYEVRAYLSVDGSKSLNTICYTPYGTFADVWTPLETTTIAGLCPVCNKHMKMPEAGFFTCSDGHPIVKMTTTGYTERLLRGQTSLKKKPIKSQSRYTFPKDEREWMERAEVDPRTESTVTIASVKDQVAKALEDLL